MNQIGRYEIIAELGRGAMGVVYRARDSRIGREVAMKTIRLSDKFDETEAKQLRDRLFREAQSAGRLSHPGIVTIYDIDEEDGLAFITMELVDGRTLEELLKAKEVRDIGFVTNMLLRTAAALDYAHEREIIHRDIKPGNIMITKDGRVKITDFGIARVSSSTMTQTGVVMGTPSYMSPEQVRGETISGRSDQFSLAVVVYEVLTGSKPFAGDGVTTVIFKIVSRDPTPPRELNPNLSDGIANAILTALSKSPDDRYTSCTQFAEAFAAASESTESSIFAPIDPSQTLLIPQEALTGDEATSLGVPPKAEKSDGAKVVAKPSEPPPVSPDDLTVADVAAKPQRSGSGSMPAAPAAAASHPAPAKAKPTAEPEPEPAAQEPALPPRTAIRADPEPEPSGNRVWLGIVAAILLVVGAAGFYIVNNPALLARLGLGGAAASGPATPDSGNEAAETPAAGAADTSAASASGADAGTSPATDANTVATGGSEAANSAPAGSSGSTTASIPVTPPPTAKSSHPPAKTAPSTPELVAVNFKSSVPGVQVAVDSKADFSCITPCSLEMPPGEHRAVARLAGYELKIESFNLDSEPLNVDLAMRQQVSTVFISSDPAGAEILVDGKKTGSVTNTRIDIPLGFHLITVRKGAAGTAERNVLMREGELRQLRFKLAPGSPPRGQVTFKSTPPGAQIILNDNAQSGVTPRELRIAPGNYRVTFSLSGYRPVIKEFEVNEDETLTVEATLSSQN